jgi:N-acyl-D-amino-acid deacylase
MRKFLAGGVALVVVCTAHVGTAVSGAPASGAVYQAIRTNDLTQLATLVPTSAEANARGDFGNTPLMSAAIAGSIDAMTLLIGKGADVNAQNAFGTTALMMSATQRPKVQLLLDRGASVDTASKQGRTALFVAAMSDPSADIVRLLIAKGADVKAKDAFQNTMLNAAAVGDDAATIRIMLDAGIDANAAGVTGMSPLIAAAYHRDLAVVKLLLAKGANVNAVAKVPLLFPGGDPKSGPVALSDVTPLLAAVTGASPELVKTLLDAGATVNAKDGRGLTPLMLAVATTRQDSAVIRMLLDRGADAAAQDNAGETAEYWARKQNVPAGMRLLKLAPTQSPAPVRAAAAATATMDVKTAAERGLALLETSSQKFFESSGCVSCHHQNATGLAAGEARARGLRVDAKATMARVEMLKAGPPPPLLLERMDIGVPAIFASALAALAAENVPPNPVTDVIAAHIAATQSADGSWHLLAGIGDRPPTAETGFNQTALCVRTLKVYAPPARAAETKARIDKAREWLLAATPVTAEDRAMRALGVYWSGADAAALRQLVAPVREAQQADGGWRQHDGLPTDAYATGQSLYVLAKAGGVAASDAAYQKGVRYLLTTQSDNGSWHVASRAPKFQAYFNSGFPYSGDQWISAWATSWATMALAQAVPAPATQASK